MKQIKKAFVFFCAILLIIGLIATVDSHHFGVAGSCLILIVAILISEKIEKPLDSDTEKTEKIE